MARRILAPVRLEPEYDLAGFANGRHPTLDDWLKRRALACEGLSARTYVACAAEPPERVVGYDALSSAMAQRTVLPTAKLRQGLPEDVPLLLIGRLAVDQNWRGQGLGTALLADALRRCLAVSEIAGLRGVIVHAFDDEAVEFYRKNGFTRSPLGERVMIMAIETIRAVMRS
jgi:GNAT superfamily N-acetyltransferase